MKFAAVLLLLALAGCVTPKPIVEVRTITQTVEVPVPCSPKKPARPPSAVDALPLDAEIDEQMRALRADRVRSRAYATQLENALAACG